MLRATFIDESGELQPRSHVDFARLPAKQSSGAHKSLSARAIDERGCVQVISGRSTSTILVLNSQTVKLACITGAIRWLQKNKPARIVLQDNVDAHAVPQILQWGSTIEWLRRLNDARKSQQRFRRRPIDINQSHFATRWEAAREILTASLNLDVQSHILSKLFQQHFVVTERDPSSGHFLLVDAGLAVEGRMCNLGTLKIGSPFTVLEDAQFGQWIANGMREFTPSDKPVAEVLEIGLQAKSGNVCTLRYSRLVVPYTRDGRDHLATAACIECC